MRDLGCNQFFALKKSRERFRGKLDRQRKLEEVKKHEQTGNHLNCVKFIRAWEENNFLFIQTELCATTLDQVSSSESILSFHLLKLLHLQIDGLDTRQ